MASFGEWWQLGVVLMTKECPKCKHEMVKISPDQSLDEVWTCLNPDCGYRETINLFDKLKNKISQIQE